MIWGKQLPVEGFGDFTQERDGHGRGGSGNTVCGVESCISGPEIPTQIHPQEQIVVDGLNKTLLGPTYCSVVCIEACPSSSCHPVTIGASGCTGAITAPR